MGSCRNLQYINRAFTIMCVFPAHRKGYKNVGAHIRLKSQLCNKTRSLINVKRNNSIFGPFLFLSINSYNSYSDMKSSPNEVNSHKTKRHIPLLSCTFIFTFFLYIWFYRNVTTVRYRVNPYLSTLFAPHVLFPHLLKDL